MLPSGILNPDAVCVIGNGVVVHIPSFLNELDNLEGTGINYEGRVLLSDRAHLVFDFHQAVDGKLEQRLGRNKIGTTKKGIGPAYASKISRNGLRVGDLKDWDYFEQRFRALAEHHERSFAGLKIDVEEQLKYYKTVADRVANMTVDTIEFTNRQYKDGKKILVEGANATMLDIDFGTYPFVTSSNTVTAGTCTGLGVAPTKIGDVIGIFKAYCTRVGSGPFPTELDDEVGERIRKEGSEFGATTGRPRRCGWVDIPQLKYAIMINGVTELSMMKADVLDAFETIKVCTHYLIDGERYDYFPYDVNDVEVVPVYEEVKGWNTDTTKLTSMDDAPAELKDYVQYLEQKLEVPITTVSVGPDRTQTLQTLVKV